MRVKKWSNYAQNLRFVKSARKVKVKITRKIGDFLNCARKIRKTKKPIYAHILQISKSVLVNLNCNRSSDFYDFCRRQSIVVRMRAHVVVPTICICIYLTVQLLFGWERF